MRSNQQAQGAVMSTYAPIPETVTAAPPVAGTPAGAAIVLAAATVLTGMSTGVIALYAHTIMPGLKKTNDRTFVGAFQAIDRAIINPWFMLTFFGALVLIGVSGIMHLVAHRHAALPWLAVAFLLYLVAVIITMVVHVPANNAIDAAGDPGHIDVAQVRAAFNESRWALWNDVRLALAFGSFVILTGALAVLKR
jgi:uncharacterized membrane protein